MTSGGVESTLIVDIVFWTIAVSTIVAALAVVHLRDVFRAALPSSTARVIRIANSISTEIAILMTRDVEEGSPSNRLRIPAAVVSALFAAAAIFVAVSTDWNLLEAADLGAEASAKASEVFSNTVPWIARLLIRDFVLAFEIAGVLLLAAIIGALALVRER